MKRFSIIILGFLLLSFMGSAWGQSPLCPKGKTVLVPYVDALVIPVVPKPNHCVVDPTDSDNDGMADSWELAWFGDLDAANGLGYMTDVDEDGISDLEEYEKGGNPTINDAAAILTGNHCQQRYLPFGDEFNADECGQIKHAGRVQDKGTGLHYNRARYYDAVVGQFLSPDPVRAVDLHTGEVNLSVLLVPQRLNAYAYALNNPYRYIDPLGEFAEDPDIGSPANLLMASEDGTGGASLIDQALYDLDELIDPTSYTPFGTIGKGVNIAKGLIRNPMFKKALENFKNTRLTNAGRGLTKHPEVVKSTKETLRQTLKSDAQINQAASEALKNIMRNGVQSRTTHPRYGEIVTYQIKGGFGARFNAHTNEFIGFINP